MGKLLHFNKQTHNTQAKRGFLADALMTSRENIRLYANTIIGDAIREVVKQAAEFEKAINKKQKNNEQ